jgi:hypothetical protein
MGSKMGTKVLDTREGGGAPKLEAEEEERSALWVVASLYAYIVSLC